MVLHTNRFSRLVTSSFALLNLSNIVRFCETVEQCCTAAYAFVTPNLHPAGAPHFQAVDESMPPAHGGHGGSFETPGIWGTAQVGPSLRPHVAPRPYLRGAAVRLTACQGDGKRKP